MGLPKLFNGQKKSQLADEERAGLVGVKVDVSSPETNRLGSEGLGTGCGWVVLILLFIFMFGAGLFVGVTGTFCSFTPERCSMFTWGSASATSAASTVTPALQLL